MEEERGWEEEVREERGQEEERWEEEVREVEAEVFPWEVEVEEGTGEEVPEGWVEEEARLRTLLTRIKVWILITGNGTRPIRS